jgi:DNA-directed RNA polymerase specialized sigma24 family protein
MALGWKHGTGSEISVAGNCYLAERRRRSSGEIPTDQLPEIEVTAPAPETRLVVLAALAGLPPKYRAVVVLRYWADLSVEEAAAVLNCSPGNVRSQSARALSKLRVSLGEALSDTSSPVRPLADRPRRKEGPDE